MKTFEQFNEKKVWKIRTDEPYFSAGLNKLELSEYQINMFHSDINWNRIKKLNYIYIFNNDYGWVWMENNNLSQKHTYMGEVEINEEDIENWEMKIDTKNFNL